jgi:hypothetical protein
MDNVRVFQELQFQHRHDDGSWAEMERVPHDQAEHDPERSWAKGQIFRCTKCAEQIRVESGVEEEGGPPPRF